MVKNIFIASLLAALVSSCGVYKKFENKPEAAVVEDLYNYSGMESSGESLASLGWRELFTDPHLQSLIEQGINHNTDLRIARLNVEQAKVVLRVSRLRYTPTVDLSAGGAVTDFRDVTTRSYDITASASWEIDIFGKLRNAKEQSKAALEQSKAYEQAVQTSLISTIATNYYSLLLLDEQLRISRETLVNWDENIRAMEALKRAGRLNSTSVLQSQASRVALARSIITYEEQIAELENSLSTLLCTVPQKIERGVIVDTQMPTELSVGLPLEMVSKRPDVRMAEYALEESFYATLEARSSLYPSFTLSGSLGFTNGSGGSISNPADLLLNAVGSVVQPLFNRGVLRGELEISKAQQEQALLTFNQSLLDAGAEVNTALIGWQSAQTRIAHDVAQMELLTKALSSAEMLMRHGNVNYLEVLAAQLSLLNSQITYANNRFDEVHSVISLYRSLGGGAN